MIGEKAAHHRGVGFDPPLGRKAIAKRTRTSQVEVAEGLAGKAWKVFPAGRLAGI
jgi:hypothetical protein